MSDLSIVDAFGTTATFGTFGFLMVIFGSLYAAPAYACNLLPYLFVVYLVGDAMWHAILAARMPRALPPIQSDLEL
jgi:hypothetical protein